jgi:dienelactone hydrolase
MATANAKSKTAGSKSTRKRSVTKRTRGKLAPGAQGVIGVLPQRPAYNKAAAERHWERLFALFGGALR